MKKSNIDVSKLVSALIAIVVVAAVIFAGFTMWLKLRPQAEDTSALAGPSTTQSTSTLNGTGDGGQPSGPAALEGGGEGNNSETGDTAGNPGGVNNSGGGDNTAVNGAAKPDYSIPKGGTTYTVKRGDKLMKIAKNFYGDESMYKLILEANKLDNADKIQVGQVLKIPEKP